MPENFESLRVHIDRLEGLLDRTEKTLDELRSSHKAADSRIDKLEQYVAEEKAKIEAEKKAMGKVKWWAAFFITAILGYIVKILVT